MNHPKSLVIAVDGPAASGKGTLARRLARAFDFALLDTGALYRAVGLSVLRQGGNPTDETAALAAAERVAADVAPWQDDPDLRSDRTGAAASRVAAIPAVRKALFDLQRRFAAEPPGGVPGAVLDGRDIGTVICPDADAKLFITASVEVRAERRWNELRQRGQAAIYSVVLEDMKDRDSRDSQRTAAPLKPAPDAVVLDTSSLDADAVLERALAFLRSKPDFATVLRL